ncbi:toll-like receptor 4 [Branchiostoma floridae]|uniref:Toll-like receptor 4 n=1 Tax=Branchiostoma floridae TaxID=7739 RepID=A0A9J7LQW2_BRAFL|nr:toll-like receptor 4 [Branchiostoma floridae]
MLNVAFLSLSVWFLLGMPVGNADNPHGCQVWSPAEVTCVDTFQLTVVPPDLPESILRLDLQGNRIKELYRQPFNTLKHLEYLDLTWTRFEYVENGTFAGMTNLRTLNLSRNDLGDSQWSNITSSLPSLRTLILSNNRLQHLSRWSFKGLHNLTFLDLSSNAIIVGECAFCGQQRLKRLDMTSNEISTLPNRLFHPQSELELLDLSNNRLTDDVLEKEELWLGLSRLRTLLVRRNYLSIPKFAQSFRNLTSLNTITMSDLGWNNISIIDEYAFTGLESLDKLRIATITSRMFEGLENVTVLDLSLNDVLEIEPYGFYDNEFQPNLPLACALSSSAIVFYMFAVFLISYYHWKIKYLMFLLRRRNEDDDEPMRGRRFVYDAFVAHNSEDIRWVVHELCHNLEDVQDQPRYKLCIHQRNFLPGAPIVNNIVKAIETSRKTICVLTRSFLRSGWCEFELQLAQTPDNLFGKGGSCRLILVFLEKIPRPLLKKYKHLEAVMDRDTYLEWPGDARGRPLFWRRLRAALGKPVNDGQAGDGGMIDDDGHELVPLNRM